MRYTSLDDAYNGNYEFNTSNTQEVIRRDNEFNQFQEQVAQYPRPYYGCTNTRDQYGMRPTSEYLQAQEEYLHPDQEYPPYNQRKIMGNYFPKSYLSERYPIWPQAINTQKTFPYNRIENFTAATSTGENNHLLTIIYMLVFLSIILFLILIILLMIICFYKK